jgi:hypothetical protein
MLNNIILKILAYILFMVFARTAEAGSNAYVSAITRDASHHGEMWKDDRTYDAGVMITSQEGQRFGDKIWTELVEVVDKADPSVKAILASR